MMNLKVNPGNQLLAILRDEHTADSFLGGFKEGPFMTEPKLLEIFSDYI